ncbi:MAG TPA: nuclear transport factor 2 family protein [Alphaproteobacteria bacterium]|jgi:hypothetical protein|nr:nuclear transport factor 2 family protein [Alphaproteobacteria bacterium]
MTDLTTFVEAMDRCWMERRFLDLADFLADNVVIVAPGGVQRSQGLEAAIKSYREFMAHSSVGRFQTSGYVVTEHGTTAVVEYDWAMSWRTGAQNRDAAGREVLTLSGGPGAWRVIWRMQLPG